MPVGNWVVRKFVRPNLLCIVVGSLLFVVAFCLLDFSRHSLAETLTARLLLPPSPMAGLLARALRLAARRSPPPPLPILSALLRRPLWLPSAVASPLASSLLLPSRISEGGYLPSPRDSCFTGALGVLFVGASRRWYRKVRRSPRVRPRRTKEKPLELDVEICIEEELPEDPQLLVNFYFSFGDKNKIYGNPLQLSTILI